VARGPAQGYNPAMSRPLHKLTAEALDLPERDRLALADALINSVEGPVDPAWEEAWLEELEARRRHGTADVRPWAEVRDSLLSTLDSQ